MQFGRSKRRACQLSGLSRRLVQELPRLDRDAALKERLAFVWRPNTGFRMAHALVKADFAPLTVKWVPRGVEGGAAGPREAVSNAPNGQFGSVSATGPDYV